MCLSRPFFFVCHSQIANQSQSKHEEPLACVSLCSPASEFRRITDCCFGEQKWWCSVDLTYASNSFYLTMFTSLLMPKTTEGLLLALSHFLTFSLSHFLTAAGHSAGTLDGSVRFQTLKAEAVSLGCWPIFAAFASSPFWTSVAFQMVL